MTMKDRRHLATCGRVRLKISHLCYIFEMSSSSWHVRLSQEIAEWFLEMAVRDRDSVRDVLNILEERGPTLRMPSSRALGNGLFELRFRSGGSDWRITYCYGSGNVIYALTVFRKQRQRETREIARARKQQRHLKKGV